MNIARRGFGRRRNNKWHHVKFALALVQHFFLLADNWTKNSNSPKQDFISPLFTQQYTQGCLFFGFWLTADYLIISKQLAIIVVCEYNLQYQIVFGLELGRQLKTNCSKFSFSFLCDKAVREKKRMKSRQGYCITSHCALTSTQNIFRIIQQNLFVMMIAPFIHTENNDGFFKFFVF